MYSMHEVVPANAKLLTTELISPSGCPANQIRNANAALTKVVFVVSAEATRRVDEVFGHTCPVKRWPKPIARPREWCVDSGCPEPRVDAHDEQSKRTALAGNRVRRRQDVIEGILGTQRKPGEICAVPPR